MKLEELVRKIHRARFWRDKKIIWPLIIALLVNLVDWPYIYFKMRQSGQLVPLRYNILNGVGAIGHWTKLLSLPFYGLIIFLLNAILVYKFYEKEDRFIVRLLLITTLCLEIIFLVAVILITNL